MSKINKVQVKKAIRALIDAPEIFFQRSQYILLLSHMRSRSSLLSHILGSHPKIRGYCELHQSYTKDLDFLKSKVKISSLQKKETRARILFDKILHNHYTISSDKILKKKIKVLFMVREPISSVSSIAYTFDEHPDEATILRAINYYIDRLNLLEDIFLSIPANQRYVVNSENLILHTEVELMNLSQWLGFKNTLSKKYKTFSKTGMKNYGDFSTNISKGDIVKKTDSPLVKITSDQLEILENRFKRFNEITELNKS